MFEVVDLNGGVAAQVSALPYVRAVTPFHPSYKLDEQLISEQFSNPMDTQDQPSIADQLRSEPNERSREVFPRR